MAPGCGNQIQEPDMEENESMNCGPVPESIVLSDRDWEQFLAALEHPAEPNEPLKKLMKEFGPWKGSPRSKK
jgi:hypothetical protein